MFTCCSIRNALLGPSLISLSGEGKLRKEDTSGGRGADGGVDICEKKGREKTSKTPQQQVWLLHKTFCNLFTKMLS